MEISKQRETSNRVEILEIKPQQNKLKTTLGSITNQLDHTEEKISIKDETGEILHSDPNTEK